MLTIQLRNLPESLYLAIQKSAVASKRSMTKEAIFLIETALKVNHLSVNQDSPKTKALSELKKLANQNQSPLSLEEINSFISEDRNR